MCSFLGLLSLMNFIQESLSNSSFNLVFWFANRWSLEFSNNTLFMFFFSHWLFVKVEALEESSWKEFDQNTPDKFSWTKDQANTILPHFKRIGLGNFTSNFYHGHLNDEGDDWNGNEQPVSANPVEDVEGTCQQSCIHLIENLHEHEDLEDVSHMKKFFSSTSLRCVLRKIEIVSCGSSK